MLPHPHHPPPRLPQEPAHLQVPLLVPLNLLPPERRIRPRLRPVDRAPMPETPIHKHRHPRRAKHKIRLPVQRMIPPPPRDLVRPENLDQPQFRIPVPLPANPRHHLAPLGFGEYVRHQPLALQKISNRSARKFISGSSDGCPGTVMRLPFRLFNPSRRGPSVASERSRLT